MTGDSKDARHFFVIKKKVQEKGIEHELRLNFVKVQAEMKAYNERQTMYTPIVLGVSFFTKA